MPEIKLTQAEFNEKVIQYLHLIIADNFKIKAMLSKLIEVNPDVNCESFQKLLSDHQKTLIDHLQNELFEDHGVLPNAIKEFLNQKE